MKQIAILFAVILPGIAAAAGSNVALTGKVGTLGWGGDLTARISPDWNGRVGINGYNWSGSQTVDSIKYKVEADLLTVSAILDYFPQRGDFRISGGFMYNGNQAKVNSPPNASGTYTLDGNNYAASEISSLSGKLNFDAAAPYIGLGYGNPLAKGSKWKFALDAGVLYQGEPNVTLTATCGVTTQCAAIQSSVAAERRRLESSAERYTWYPVISIGVSYKF